MTRSIVRLVTLLVCVAFGSSLSFAQNQQSWVSGVGDDTNPCTRTAPCLTFSGAFAKTNQNGEIDVLDPGHYGTLSISKSITIDGTGTFAGVLANLNSTAIIISIDPIGTDIVHTVRLRGLSISGAGINSKTGNRGIRILSPNPTDLKVFIEDIVIDGFSQEGILYNANGGDLVVKNSTIRNNNGPGIMVDSAGANLVHVTVEKTSLVLNGEGIRFEDNVRGGVFDSTISNNTTNGVAVVNVTRPSVMQLDHTRISENRQVGVLTGGAVTFGTATLSECMIIHNNIGLQSNAGGQIKSFGQNRIAYNITSDGAFTPPIIPEQ